MKIKDYLKIMKKKVTDLLTELYKVLCLTLPLLLFISGSGWVADGFKGELLGEGWVQYSNNPNVLALRIGILIIAILLTLGGAYWLYRIRKHYLPVAHLERCEQPTGIYALVATVSAPFKWKLEFPDGKMPHLKCAGFDNFLPESLEEVTALPLRSWNWQQLLRAIKPHAKELKLIYLIGSPTFPPINGEQEMGSFDTLEDCKKLILAYLPNVEVCCAQESVNFEDIAILYNKLNQTIDQLGYEKNEIILDVTGGQKTASIVTALVTLHHPKLHFQYVQSGTPYRVFYHNVVAGISSSIGD